MIDKIELIDLRCPACGQLLAKNFSGGHIEIKCHRHPFGGVVVVFDTGPYGSSEIVRWGPLTKSRTRDISAITE